MSIHKQTRATSRFATLSVYIHSCSTFWHGRYNYDAVNFWFLFHATGNVLAKSIYIYYTYTHILHNCIHTISTEISTRSCTRIEPLKVQLHIVCNFLRQPIFECKYVLHEYLEFSCRQ